MRVHKLAGGTEWRNACRNAVESKTISLRFNSLIEGGLLCPPLFFLSEKAYHFIDNHVSGIY